VALILTQFLRNFLDLLTWHLFNIDFLEYPLRIQNQIHTIIDQLILSLVGVHISMKEVFNVHISLEGIWRFEVIRVQTCFMCQAFTHAVNIALGVSYYVVVTKGFDLALARALKLRHVKSIDFLKDLHKAYDSDLIWHLGVKFDDQADGKHVPLGINCVKLQYVINNASFRGF
jgi:hypothetical protein